MRKRTLSAFHNSPDVKGYPQFGKKYKPLRYFIAGGADIDGETKDSAQAPQSDPDTDSDTVMAEVFGVDDNGDLRCPVDIMCDPRQDVFSVVSMATLPTTRMALEELKRKVVAKDSGDAGNAGNAGDAGNAGNAGDAGDAGNAGN